MDLSSHDLWTVLEALLVRRGLADSCDDCGDEECDGCDDCDMSVVLRDPLRADLWRAAIDRATFGLAVLARLAAGDMDVERAASFLAEMETDPDGLREAFEAFLDRV